MKRAFASLGALFLLFSAQSQIVVDPNPTPVQLVENVLIGNGVTASNITFVGENVQLGSFDGTNSNIGLNYGVVMSSGTILDIVPPNQPSTGQYGNPGDPDLLTVAQSVTSNPQAGMITTTFDAAILEFDFVPIGDSVRFNFVFASEEYQTYINTQYNDAFGFFISGPGFAGPFAAPPAFPNGAENLAVVPGTTDPITISTIHPGLNSSYYIDDPNGATQSFNGFTVPITIEFQVVCGQTYHFKFAVADCQDDFLDTGVFLEGGSFSSEAVDIAVATVNGDTTVFEGCTDADFIFSRPLSQAGDSLVINYDITGTAINGTDYNQLGDSVLFLPGQDTVILNLTPTADGLTEGAESVTITAYTISPCGDTLISTGTVWILDEPDIQIASSDTTIFCLDSSALVSVEASGGFEPYNYSWNSGSQTNSETVTTAPPGPTEYYVTATDQCGYSNTDTVTVYFNQTLMIDSMNTVPSSPCGPTGIVTGFTSGENGVANYTWTGPDTNQNFVNAALWQNLNPGWYYFSVNDDVCWAEDSVYLDVTAPPVAQMLESPSEGCNALDVNFINQSQNATSFEWDFGTTVVNVNNMDPQGATFTSTTDVYLVAFDPNMCADTTMVTITIYECGCTDPTAMNFDPAAVVDDGSCFFPKPIVICPNVFTPNNDEINDIFELDLTHAIDLEIVILNRWGNLMYSANGLAAGWDGRSQNGAEAEDGTYFVRYTVTGIDGETQVSGHTHFQLIRH